MALDLRCVPGATQIAPIGRSQFASTVGKCIRRSGGSSAFAVLLLDLDYFKAVNDSLGRTLADGFLNHVDCVLRGCAPQARAHARLGGDEFAILVETPRGDDARANATELAARVHRALEAPAYLNGNEIRATVSIGIVTCESPHRDPEELLRDAETAMYEAKASGRSRHVIFESSMRTKAVVRSNLQMALHGAVAREEFCVDYQPVVNLKTRRVVGFEALVRWNHPQRGRLLPHAFLEEAENIGAIAAMDRWVLREASRQIALWQRQFDDPDLFVSVNASSSQFGHPGLLREVGDSLARNALSAQSLKLEITETVLMENLKRGRACATSMRALGVDLYVDDFGTGYSSLSYLAQLPVTTLKVDRSFVSAVTSDARSAEIARSIVALARNLNLVALAEGIESEEQLATFLDLGCTLGQGYLFSRPVSAEAARELVVCRLPLAESHDACGWVA